ncbi:hypothetical protein FRB97_001182 [Tulasnella sp. 331]|nr:hypothetical protein FRB97_001182 [Tulasnella sp. 331]
MLELPDELIDTIISDSSLDSHDRFAAARTCRHFYPISIPHLYSSVTISENSDSTASRCVSFLKSILTNERALLVRALDCTIWMPMLKDERREFWRSLASGLQHTRHLRSLRMSITGRVAPEIEEMLEGLQFITAMKEQHLTELEELHTNHLFIGFLASGRPCKTVSCFAGDEPMFTTTVILAKLPLSTGPVRNLSIRLSRVMAMQTTQSMVGLLPQLVSLHVEQPLPPDEFVRGAGPILAELVHMEHFTMSGCHDSFWDDVAAVEDHPPLQTEQEMVESLASHNANLRSIQVNVLLWSRHDGVGPTKGTGGSWTPRPDQSSLGWWFHRFGGAASAEKEIRKRWGEEYRICVNPDGTTMVNRL